MDLACEMFFFERSVGARQFPLMELCMYALGSWAVIGLLLSLATVTRAPLVSTTLTLYLLDCRFVVLFLVGKLSAAACPRTAFYCAVHM